MKPRKRSAFTLLELLIALALLGGLLLLAWSIMGTLRLAESRTEGLAGRVRIIQSARNWLENDLQHLVGGMAGPSNTSSVQAGMPLGAFSTSGTLSGVTLSAGNPGTTVFFQGDPGGFVANLLPSFDPLWMMEPWFTESSTTDVMPRLPHPNRTVRVEYRAVGDRAISDGASFDRGGGESSRYPSDIELGSRVQPETDRSVRENTALAEDPFRSPDGPRSQSENGLRRTVRGLQKPTIDRRRIDVGEQRQLTTADLYRLTDVDSLGKREAESTTSATLSGLQRLRFRYGDGRRWHSSWDHGSRGGLPRAIEVCFDLVSPAKASTTNESDRRGSNGSSREDAANRYPDPNRIGSSSTRRSAAALPSGRGSDDEVDREDYQHRMVFFIESGRVASSASGSRSGRVIEDRSSPRSRQRGGNP